ncbi:MAG TPA: prolyl oligopeptidase family serine peptidase [Candidatus Baltobacteraceae bacterium]|jgi:prolyl oligopeptidase|nr:prolyl oligopeptidase family serine peptidase [Candidatus Baltobacteraceae bacterium]
MSCPFKSRAVVALGIFLGGALPCAFAANDMNSTNDDRYLWLENVSGGKALDWVREQNAASTGKLEASPGFTALEDRLLAILNSHERIPAVAKHGKYYYNFWRDDKNVRGLWRRTTLEEYKKPNPAWETVLDLDQLASEEKENWVWHGYTVLEPSYDRCLVELSRGGADADVVREFDLKDRRFLPGGFTVPEAKTDVAWKNRNTLYVGTDFGPGSLTSSGYPRVIKEWRRGAPLSEAVTVFEGQPEDVEVSVSVEHDHGHVYEMIRRGVTFFTDQAFLRRGDQWVRIEKPDDATVETFGRFLLLRLRSDWSVDGKTFAAGSLLVENLEDYLGGARDLTILFQPTERASLDSITDTKHYLGLTELDNVHSRPYWLRFRRGQWERTAINAPAFGTVSISGIDSNESDDYFMSLTDFLTPSSLYLGVAGKPDMEKIKALPAFFNADGLEIQQFDTKSRDGTRVPYFQVARKGLRLDGSNITMLNGYGGFEIPMLPGYNSFIGAAWLERGGVYVLANIRGGGEFGPKWHEAARKQNRQRAYDDFIAVAEDLIARGVTSARHLGIEGRSNGGLLMGVMLTERPDLFGAVHCGSPLLDMRRYNKLLAGASWMDEYGDPDNPEDWAYIRKYSPYQNTRADEKYPPILITTSTRDDRVHPGHARKMAARLEEEGHDVLYYENTEGGHGAAANNKQSAFMEALAYTFLWNELSR